MNASPLRDQRIGRLLAKRGCRALSQAEQGGTQLQNIVRIAEWRSRYALVPIEQTISPQRQPTERARF